jgi:hypothetical protein
MTVAGVVLGSLLLAVAVVQVCLQASVSTVRSGAADSPAPAARWAEFLSVVEIFLVPSVIVMLAPKFWELLT